MDEGGRDKIDTFLTHLRTERRLSPHTLKSYRNDLRAWADFCASTDSSLWSEVDSYHIRSFAAACHRKGLAPRSIQRRLSAVRGFFAYLVREDLLQANPAGQVSAPNVAKRLPATLDADQMARLLRIEGEGPLAARDRAIMELLYSSGLRLAELAAASLTDLDLRDATIRVTGKGNKTRIAPIGRYARETLEVWLRYRGGLALPEEAALFVSSRGGRLSHRSIQARIRLWSRRQGLNARVHPHVFRHSCATHLLESSGDLRGVQELLGHANISTTQIYTHLDFQHLARIYDQTHPRARKRR